jgi:MinD-like ATPase involved in chromosome partitioning or flagellar assembly
VSARVPVLVALAGLAQEQALVAVLDRASGGTQVVRRCVDLADLLGAASTRTASVAVVAADLRRLDREALEHLTHVGLAVVGVTAPGDDEGERRLRQLGVLDILRADAPEDEVLGVVLAAPLRRLGSSQQAIGAHGLDPDLRDSLDAATDLAPGAGLPVAPPAHAFSQGTIIAVWGPTGAPGRTTVAVTLAAEAAHAGIETLLVDADTYGSSIAQVLGLLDEAPGLAAAARAANSGRLDVAAVARAAREVTPRLRVLTGFARSDRWPELRASSLEVVLEQCRWLAELTVVDVGFCLEQDEELVYDTAAPRRNGATLATLSVADTVLAVGSADPVGLQRLLRALPEVRTLTSGEVAVVINRVRRGVAGGSPREALADLVARHAGVTPTACLPEDRTSCDLALAAGRTLTEVAPRSALRTSLTKLASQLVAQSSPQNT